MTKLYGIGIGPGDSELITIKARNILSSADYIFVPQSKADRDSVAYNIVKPFIKEQVEIVPLLLPMTKDMEKLQEAWRQGAAEIKSYLKEGKTGAFITLGDCMLYSTYTYLLKELSKIAPDLAIENIPGITSFAAAASKLTIPLAEAEESLAIIPALKDFESIRTLLEFHDNVVFLKVAPNIDSLIAGLKEMGLLANAVFISKCGHPDQQIVYDVEQLAGKQLEYLSLMIVKKGGI